MPQEKPWNNQGHGFLKFNSMPPRVHVLSDDTEFDQVFLKHLKQEGFNVNYLPYTGNAKEFKWTIQHLSDELELGQSYAMIAFGEAATLALDVCLKPTPHCCALIAYYPTKLPSPNAKYPTQLDLLVHLAGNQPFAPSYKAYVYPDSLPGFAEMDLEEYDKVSGSLAWSRTLGVLRDGFKISVDLESVVEDHNRHKYGNKDARMTMTTLSQVPYMNNVPTMTGGIGRAELDRFYRSFFLPSNPPSLKLRLLSRTIGVEKVVDEIMVSFRHTQVMPWILPEVPATNKAVQVPVVSIVSIRGGKLCHEQLYWDQASVLVQIGLLDPKLVPNDMKKKGLERLPVTGKEAAEKVLDESTHPSNDLISAWAEDGATTEATDA